MSKALTILYRGPLSSCNYDCHYCPFAKRHESAEELQADRDALEKFVDWAVKNRDRSLSVFFTPWGEALTRRWYHTAIQELSRCDHIVKIAVQTNLSWSLDWLNDCDRSKLGFWCTYHPTQVARKEFLSRCEQLRTLGVSHSVGMVAIPTDYDEIELMRSELPNDTYLWLNAYDVGGGQKYQYSAFELSRMLRVDPHFCTNVTDHESLGRFCNAGTTVFSVNGDGTVRRCHFVKAALGNLYDPNWAFPTELTTCPNQVCGCHIGYIHMPHLHLDRIYGRGLLERVPTNYVSHCIPDDALSPT